MTSPALPSPEPYAPHLDVTGTVDLREARGVFAALNFILTPALGEGYGRELLLAALEDVEQAYRGELADFLPSDTPYHDLRHAFDTALAMTRLVDGYVKAESPPEALRMSPTQGLLAVLLALFHDVGLLRRPAEAHLKGGALIPVHEARSVDFAREWLSRTALAPLADQARLILATRLDEEIAADLSPIERVIARMLGVADIVSQISDRYYLEKCRDFLFDEFAAMGSAGHESSPFPTPEDLLRKTPEFILGPVNKRLSGEQEGVLGLLDEHFRGESPYRLAMENNFRHLEKVLRTADFTLLRRQPTSPSRDD